MRPMQPVASTAGLEHPTDLGEFTSWDLNTPLFSGKLIEFEWRPAESPSTRTGPRPPPAPAGVKGMTSGVNRCSKPTTFDHFRLI